MLAGLLASAATYWGAATELDELLDDQLKAIADHVVVQPDGHLSLRGMQGANEDRLSGEQSHAVLLQIWRGTSSVFSTDIDSDLPPPLRAGYADITIGGQRWHTYVTRNGDMLVRVAQAGRAHREALAEIAMHLFWPVMSMIPILALFLWFGIGYGLSPLRVVATSLKRRDAENMHKIDTDAMPNEVRPLVDSVNDLLQRLEDAFTVHRQFIADAAHELRTPIMGLALQAELLPKLVDPTEREVVTEQIQLATNRLARLAGQLLTLARLASDALQPVMSDVDLTALARSVVSEHARLAHAKGIDLGLVAKAAVCVNGNADCLRILLNNLIDNASRYAGPTAHVDVIVEEDEAPTLTVIDSGPGIAEEERKRVWERFYRGSGHPTEGSGLGLSIVWRVTEQHRAVAALGSGPNGNGLAVKICFPKHTS